MNTDDQLGRTLREHSADVHGVPLTLADVRGRARSIRRRRAAGTVAALAVVAAVVAPVALLGGHDGSRSPEPAPSPTRAVDPGQPGLPTLQDGVIIHPDGPRIPLRLGDAQVQGFTPLGTDRYIVVSFEDDDSEVILINEAGNDVDRFEAAGGGALAVAADRSAVAWMRSDGSPQLLVAGSDKPQSLGHLPRSAPYPTAITGDCATGCEVLGRYEDRRGGLGSSWAMSADGSARDLPDAVPAVLAASSNGLLGALDGIAEDDIHACGGVWDQRTDQYLWHGCEDNQFLFSPDGALVATTFGEGLGPTSVAIRDARSGAEVQRIGRSGDWIPSYAWEDSEHLLVVVVAEGGTTSLQRLGVDGSRTTVLDGFTTSMDDLEPAIILPSS
jgi:hypothetical protein